MGEKTGEKPGSLPIASGLIISMLQGIWAVVAGDASDRIRSAAAVVFREFIVNWCQISIVTKDVEYEFTNQDSAGKPVPRSAVDRDGICTVHCWRLAFLSPPSTWCPMLELMKWSVLKYEHCSIVTCFLFVSPRAAGMALADSSSCAPVAVTISISKELAEDQIAK